ncbi:Dipeptidyl peptidase 2 [Bienertia sinuspersici]
MYVIHFGCTIRPLQSSELVKQWFGTLFSSVAQLDLPDYTQTRSICSEITTEKDPIKGVVAALYTTWGLGSCFDTEITGLLSPFDPPSNSTVAWDWLRCSGLIFTVGCQHRTMLPSQPFNMSQFKQSCKEKFQINPHPSSPISYFGDTNIVESIKKTGSNIIFSNGLRDPYSSGA